MLTLTRQQSREVDRIAVERYGLSGLVLMENAGRGVVEVLLTLDPTLVGNADRVVTVLCGKGNNAGDGFVIARHLEIRNVRSQVILLAAAEQLQGDARSNFEILQHTNVPILEQAETIASLDRAVPGGTQSWIIDALLGTGAQGEPREPFAAAIQWMNSQPSRRLAVDVPSGLDCDTGAPAASTVRADHTCTFVAAKRGFATPSASEFLGQLHVVSIGTPPALLNEVSSHRAEL